MVLTFTSENYWGVNFLTYLLTYLLEKPVYQVQLILWRIELLADSIDSYFSRAFKVDKSVLANSTIGRA